MTSDNYATRTEAPSFNKFLARLANRIDDGDRPQSEEPNEKRQYSPAPEKNTRYPTVTQGYKPGVEGRPRTPNQRDLSLLEKKV